MNTTISVADNIALEVSATAQEIYPEHNPDDKPCLALVTRNMSPWSLLAELMDARNQAAENGDEELYDTLTYMIGREPSIDSQGKTIVYYWPGLHVEG